MKYKQKYQCDTFHVQYCPLPLYQPRDSQAHARSQGGQIERHESARFLRTVFDMDWTISENQDSILSQHKNSPQISVNKRVNHNDLNFEKNQQTLARTVSFASI